MRRGKDGDARRDARIAWFSLGEAEFAVLSHPGAADLARCALTAAEREVARLVVAGRSTAEIARARGTSVHTVGNQLASLFRKVGVGSRFELIARLRGAPRGPK